MTSIALKKSSYSDFITEAERLVRLKEGYESEIKSADLLRHEDRSDIIAQARIMMGELEYLFTSDEASQLEDVADLLDAKSLTISSVQDYIEQTGNVNGQGALRDEVAQFRRNGYIFLSLWNRFLENHNLALQTTQSKSELDSLYKAYGIFQGYKNRFGVLVSPQMESFCRFLYCRAMSKWDNVIIIEGKQGVGKSSFTYAMMTTLAEMLGMNLNLESYEGLIFKETREYCQKLFKKLPEKSPIWFDEAGNQFNKRSWWVAGQSDLINDLAINRDSGFTLALLWGDFDLLDSDLRNYRATCLITIKERGQAIVRQFNQNPYGDKAITETSKQKQKTVQSQHDAHKLLEQDLLTRMIIPYFDPELKKPTDKNWQAYMERKRGAKKQEVSIFTADAKKKADEYYKDFLISLDNEFCAVGSKINSEQLKRYSSSIVQYMSMSALSQRIARATGTTANRIFTRDNPADMTSGFITIDDVILSYITRLKAEAQGILDAAKEQGKAI